MQLSRKGFPDLVFYWLILRKCKEVFVKDPQTRHTDEQTPQLHLGLRCKVQYPAVDYMAKTISLIHFYCVPYHVFTVQFYWLYSTFSTAFWIENNSK